MKLLNIKLYGRRCKDTIHKALTMWFVDDSVLFFAHLSQIDSIGKPPSSVVLRLSHTLNIISETTETPEAKFHMKPYRMREKKGCIIGQGHITRMATMPMYRLLSAKLW